MSEDAAATAAPPDTTPSIDTALTDNELLELLAVAEYTASVVLDCDTLWLDDTTVICVTAAAPPFTGVRFVIVGGPGSVALIVKTALSASNIAAPRSATRRSGRPNLTRILPQD